MSEKTMALSQALLDELRGHDPKLLVPVFEEGLDAIFEQPPGLRFETTVSLSGERLHLVGYRRDDERAHFCTASEAPTDLVPYIGPTPADKQMDLDRKWFESHPNQTVRVRKKVEGEVLGGHRNARWVVVYQMRPGIRARIGFPGRGKPSKAAAAQWVRDHLPPQEPA